MNGAEGLIKTLSAHGVDVCFANPGTSEMQLVAAIDETPGMRAILGLFEGVVTGAADGYGRMTGKPAVTLLHLGPGLGNGLANLHNAKRAGTPVINVVGDHATHHLALDAPLTSDIAGVAKPMSDWVRTSHSPEDLAVAGAEAFATVTQTLSKVATVIAPADHAWSEGGQEISPAPLSPNPQDTVDVSEVVDQLRSAKQAALFLGSTALTDEALIIAGRIAEATGARLITETFCARLQRGAGRVATERLPYFGEVAAEFLASVDTLICIGAPPPVSFFAYPDKPGELSPAGAKVIRLVEPGVSAMPALTSLASLLKTNDQPMILQERQYHDLADGPLDAKSIGFSLTNRLPENAIVSDEAATAGLAMFNITAGAAPHDWLMLTGGSIGQGLPVAVGAAVACPDRKVVALQADGGAMYTLQSLWTMARENLDVTVVLVNNSSYAILNIELARVGVSDPGPKALSLLDLSQPNLDWCALSEGMGVPAEHATTIETFDQALERALACKGPRLIDAVIPAAHLKP
ncbi:MAG: acetolactate synthase large subunit [Woeseiaceae bacterium]